MKSVVKLMRMDTSSKEEQQSISRSNGSGRFSIPSDDLAGLIVRVTLRLGLLIKRNDTADIDQEMIQALFVYRAFHRQEPRLALVTISQVAIVTWTFEDAVQAVSASHGSYSDDDVVEALDYLAKCFPRSYIFHRNRWRGLKRSFNDTLREPIGDETREDVAKDQWRHLVRVSLHRAIKELAADNELEQMSEEELSRKLKCLLRKYIEEFFLDGETQDERDGRNTYEWPQEGWEDGSTGDLSPVPDFADQLVQKKDVLRALDQLSDAERRTVLARMAGHTYEEIAEQEGVTPAAIRKRMERALKKLGSILLWSICHKLPLSDWLIVDKVIIVEVIGENGKEYEMYLYWEAGYSDSDRDSSGRNCSDSSQP